MSSTDGSRSTRWCKGFRHCNCVVAMRGNLPRQRVLSTRRDKLKPIVGLRGSLNTVLCYLLPSSSTLLPKSSSLDTLRTPASGTKRAHHQDEEQHGAWVVLFTPSNRSLHTLSIHFSEAAANATQEPMDRHPSTRSPSVEHVCHWLSRMDMGCIRFFHRVPVS